MFSIDVVRENLSVGKKEMQAPQKEKKKGEEKKKKSI